MVLVLLIQVLVFELVVRLLIAHVVLFQQIVVVILFRIWVDDQLLKNVGLVILVEQIAC